jgi:hypothetical protein
MDFSFLLATGFGPSSKAATSISQQWRRIFYLASENSKPSSKGSRAVRTSFYTEEKIRPWPLFSLAETRKGFLAGEAVTSSSSMIKSRVC